MSADPIPSNYGNWWLTCGKRRCLHAIPGPAFTAKRLGCLTKEHKPLPGRAACGLRRPWWYPRMLARLGCRRCTACCRALGIEPGPGTPATQASLAAQHTGRSTEVSDV